MPFIADTIRVEPVPMTEPNLVDLGAQLETARDTAETLADAINAAYRRGEMTMRECDAACQATLGPVYALEKQIEERAARSLPELVIRLRLLALLLAESSPEPDWPGEFAASILADAERLATGDR